MSRILFSGRYRREFVFLRWLQSQLCWYFQQTKVSIGLKPTDTFQEAFVTGNILCSKHSPRLPTKSRKFWGLFWAMFLHIGLVFYTLSAYWDQGSTHIGREQLSLIKQIKHVSLTLAFPLVLLFPFRHYFFVLVIVIVLHFFLFVVTHFHTVITKNHVEFKRRISRA